MTVYGYWRCSTTEQDQQRQVLALKQAGCDEILGDKITGKSDWSSRLQLQRCLDLIQASDTLVISELSRLSRSFMGMVNQVSDLLERGIHIKTLDGRLEKYGDSINRLAFLELGKQRSEKQLHAHILLTKRIQGDSPEELDLVLAQLSNKVKSVSKVRTPHMDTIDTLIVDDKCKMYNTPQKRVCAYCCKDANTDHISLDIWNSKPIMMRI